MMFYSLECVCFCCRLRVIVVIVLGVFAVSKITYFESWFVFILE